MLPACGVYLKPMLDCRAGRYEVDGYIYNSAEEPKILMTGKWNESMSYQQCDLEGEPLPGIAMKEVIYLNLVTMILLFAIDILFSKCLHNIVYVVKRG